MSSSVLLYRFGAQTKFEALPLPGTSAKLFDVKMAIVKAKRLDSGRGNFDFDLSAKNASTDEEYVNEDMYIARGTRIIVCRRPADRGYGIMARLKRNERYQESGVVPAGCRPYQNVYMIDSRSQEDDEDFATAGASVSGVADKEKDHGTLSNIMVGKRPATLRPNADPEIREMEKKRMEKKRVLRSIPMSLRNKIGQSSSSAANQSEGGMPSGSLLQSNKLAFRELVEKSSRRHGLEYALKVTSTPIPEHIQCGICHGVARNAMMLPWDSEGRTACEICIREGLLRNGFLRCPLTGMDGVSPDNLLPNAGLRKAVEHFVGGVLEMMDKIESKSADDGEESTVGMLGKSVAEQRDSESKMTTMAWREQPKDNDETFDFCGDEFGGDVFAVGDANQKAQSRKESKEPTSPMNSAKISKHSRDKLIENELRHAVISVVNDSSVLTEGTGQLHDTKEEPPAVGQKERMSSKPSNRSSRERCRRRGPPPGYAIGPAQGGPYRISSGDNGGGRNLHYRAGGERLPGRYGVNGNSTRSSGKKRSRDEYVERSNPSHQQPSSNRESGYQHAGHRGGPRGRSYGHVHYH